MAELSRDLDELNLKPDACTYNILIRSAKSIDCALNLFDEMLERGIEPSIVTFGTLISALCNNSKLDEAFKLKEEMPRLYNIEPNAFVYAALIKALCKSGKLEEALSLRREISGLDSAVYSTLIRALFTD
ncbi:putative pentatricopeptide repeat-containing protein At1g53330, partial [Asparagus officinalis]